MDTIDKTKLNPKSHLYHQMIEVTLKSRTPMSHDTYMFTFALPQGDNRLGMLVTQHLIILY